MFFVRVGCLDGYQSIVCVLSPIKEERDYLAPSKVQKYLPTRMFLCLISCLIQGFLIDLMAFSCFKMLHIAAEPVLTCLYVPPDSELQIALVALFSEMLYRFPNVVVAQVTRESVQQAIGNGITAQQVQNLYTHFPTWGEAYYFGGAESMQDVTNRTNVSSNYKI